MYCLNANPIICPSETIRELRWDNQYNSWKVVCISKEEYNKREYNWEKLKSERAITNQQNIQEVEKVLKKENEKKSFDSRQSYFDESDNRGQLNSINSRINNVTQQINNNPGSSDQLQREYYYLQNQKSYLEGKPYRY